MGCSLYLGFLIFVSGLSPLRSDGTCQNVDKEFGDLTADKSGYTYTPLSSPCGRPTRQAACHDDVLHAEVMTAVL